MKNRISKAKLQESEFVRTIDKASKVNNCVLCNSKMTSSCNSHVVPRFILKGIAEKGYVSYGHALHTIDIGGVKKTTGINDAYTFRLICRKCDNIYFKHYENPDALEKYDFLSEEDKRIMLCEMALKTHLSHLNMKYRDIVMLDMVNQGKIAEMIKKDNFMFPQRIDAIEHLYYIRRLKKIMKSKKNPFTVLCDMVLDYKTKLATQTIISYNYDLNGKQIYNPDTAVIDNNHRYFYLMILPIKNKTRILFYIEKEHLHNTEIIEKQFCALSESDKLHFLFVSLLIHDQQFYMSPSLAKTIFQQDKKIVKLYVKTEASTKYQSKIKGFRKYTNYLMKQYGE